MATIRFGLNQDTFFDTDDIAAMFGIRPESMMAPRIYGFHFGEADADGDIRINWDFFTFDQSSQIATLNTAGKQARPRVGKTSSSTASVEVVRNSLRFSLSAAQSIPVGMFRPFVVHNSLTMRLVTTGSVEVTIEYELDPNFSLNWREELQEVLPDIRQIAGTEATAGNEYFQVGDRRKVGDDPDQLVF